MRSVADTPGIPPSAQSAYDQANTPQAEQQRQQAAYGAMQKVASGEALSRDDEIAVIAVAGSAIGGPEVGAAVVVAYELSIVLARALFGPAARGVDMCSPDQPPPSDPTDPNWVHVVAYADRVESTNNLGTARAPFTTDYSPGSFEALASPVLAANDEQWVNCRSSVDPGLLLQSLAAAWNKTHSGAAHTYVAWNGDYASPTSYVAASMHAGGVGSLDVNTGPMQILLHLPPGGLFGGNTKPTSTATKVATGAGIAVGGAALLTLGYAWLKGKAVSTVLEATWRRAKGAFKGGRR